MRPLLATLLAIACPAVQAAQPLPLPRLGLALDGGAPSGVALSLLFRPTDALRLEAGPLWNGVGFGAHGGLVLVPFRWAVAPSFEADVGRGFSADLSFLADRGDVPDEMGPVLAHSDYWYASGLAGLEFGSQRRLSFFIRGGVTRVWAEARGTGSSSSSGTTVSITDPSVTVTAPALKLGLQLWF